MKRIIRHTEYLLSRHDCVIIPGFGAVLARYESAKVDPDCCCVLPPKRVFTFNVGLQHSDGELASSVARAEGIAYDAASQLVASGVEQMQRALRDNGILQFGAIGTLEMAAEDAAPQFHASEEDTISVATAYLPIVQERPEAEEEPEVATTPAVKPYSPFARAMRWVASAAILILISFVASTPISIDNAALASLSPEIKHTPIEEFMPAQAEPLPSISIVVSHSPEAIIDTQAVAYDNAYLVIVASFASEADAEKHIAMHPGLRYVNNGGRCRVYAASFASEADAYAYIRTSQYGITGAWVCKL